MTIKNIEDLHDEIALEILREWTGDGNDKSARETADSIIERVEAGLKARMINAIRIRRLRMLNTEQCSSLIKIIENL